MKTIIKKNKKGEVMLTVKLENENEINDVMFFTGHNVTVSEVLPERIKENTRTFITQVNNKLNDITNSTALQ